MTASPSWSYLWANKNHDHRQYLWAYSKSMPGSIIIFASSTTISTSFWTSWNPISGLFSAWWCPTWARGDMVATSWWLELPEVWAWWNAMKWICATWRWNLYQATKRHEHGFALGVRREYPFWCLPVLRELLFVPRKQRECTLAIFWNICALFHVGLACCLRKNRLACFLVSWERWGSSSAAKTAKTSVKKAGKELFPCIWEREFAFR